MIGGNKQTDEQIVDEQIRRLMHKTYITYHEAYRLVKNKQKSLFQF